jgi:hypothetical protein
MEAGRSIASAPLIALHSAHVLRPVLVHLKFVSPRNPGTVAGLFHRVLPRHGCPLGQPIAE